MSEYCYDYDDERHLGWDDQPVLQIHWTQCPRPEAPVALDEFLAVYADEPGMIEFANDAMIGDSEEFDVGCVSNLTVKRVA